VRLASCGLLSLSLALASAAHAQPAPPPAGPPAAVAPPGAAPATPPPGDAPPLVYPVPASPPARAPSAVDPEGQEPVRAPGVETHDGFYLRLQLGVGYTRMSTSTMMSDVSLAGFSDNFGIALGGALNSHLIIYGTLVESTARRPKGKINGPLSSADVDGMTVGIVSVGGFGVAGVAGVGAGVAYYLDSNVFFAGSLLASRLVVDDVNGNTVAKTDWGFTFEGLLGKEWWVSDNWGVGVSGQVLLGAMQDHPYSNESVPTWRLTAFSVLLSASYN
jgi:hypothetical protein